MYMELELPELPEPQLRAKDGVQPLWRGQARGVRAGAAGHQRAAPQQALLRVGGPRRHSEQLCCVLRIWQCTSWCTALALGLVHCKCNFSSLCV
jgi:hypothetical protein